VDNACSTARSVIKASTLALIFLFCCRSHGQTFTITTPADFASSSNLAAINASNNAVWSILKTYDTGTVCRTISVGPSIANITSVNGSTNNLARDNVNASIDGGGTNSFHALVALATNAFGESGTVDSSSGVGTISGGTGYERSQSLKAVSGVSTDANDIASDFADVVNPESGDSVFHYVQQQLAVPLAVFPSAVRGTAELGMSNMIGSMRSDMPILWKASAMIAIWLNAYAIFRWVMSRPASEASAPVTTVMGTGVPAFQSGTFLVAMCVLASTLLASGIAVAMGMGPGGSAKSVVGQTYQAVAGISGPQAASTGVAGVLTYNGAPMTMGAWILMWLDAILDVSAMESAIIVTVTVMACQWCMSIVACRLALAASTVVY